MLTKELEVDLHKAAADQVRERPDMNNLGFGNWFADHMFVMRWDRQQGWHAARIQPYGPFNLDPAAMIFHYGQEVFEGLKAYRGDNGHIYLFRPRDNFDRLNQSALRLCMPRVPVDRMLQVLKSLVYLDRDWVPDRPGASLYIRPTMIATEPALGLRPSDTYLFFIITGPVGAYYREGFNPVKIYVESNYVRAAQGGVGAAKTGGNYAASVKALTEAHQKGFSQVLWLDAKEHRYVEEVGTSNIFFVIQDTLITPPLAGTILPGITRDSVLQLARHWGLAVEERPITITEVVQAIVDGSMQEAFASGTAAVISPLGELFYQDTTYTINNFQTGPLAQRLFTELQDIQYGRRPDPFNWRVTVK